MLFTANDAYMRGFRLYIPTDCVASIDAGAQRRALQHMERLLKADLRRSSALDFAALVRRAGQRRADRGGAPSRRRHNRRR